MYLKQCILHMQKHLHYAEFRAKNNAFSDRVGEGEKSPHSGGRGVTINEIFDRRRNAPD